MRVKIAHGFFPRAWWIFIGRRSILHSTNAATARIFGLLLRRNRKDPAPLIVARHRTCLRDVRSGCLGHLRHRTIADFLFREFHFLSPKSRNILRPP